MLRILNIEPDQYSNNARSILKTFGDLVEKNMEMDELVERISEFDILIVRLRHQITRAIMQAAPRLKVIVSATTGLDHIDLDYAAQKNIAVLSLRGELDFLRSIPATAEHTWGLLLALTRNIPWAYSSVLDRAWQRDHFIGHDLYGKRLGILGLGRIGEKVARFGLAFGMHVSAYDPYWKGSLDGVTLNESMGALFSESDILTVHIPLTSETKKIIGAREIDALPTSAYLINTSRGDVLDEAALLDAIKTQRLAGAALDVLINERQNQGYIQSPLIEYARTHANLLITPHIGGATHESMRATEVFMADKLSQYVKNNIS